MRRQHDIRVSSALLGADLTNGEKIVYIAIRSRQGNNAWCRASRQTLADDIDPLVQAGEKEQSGRKSSVTRAVQTLLEKGWVKEHKNGRWLRCIDRPAGDHTAPNGDDRAPVQENGAVMKEHRSGDDTATAGDHTAPDAVMIEHRVLKANNRKPKVKTNSESQQGVTVAFAPACFWPGLPPSEKIQLLTDLATWPHQFARATAQRLDQFGLLTKHAQQNFADTMEKWGLVFDRLQRLDGYSQEEIKDTMAWLLKPGNWWIENATFRTASKLRHKMSNGETTYFEHFLTKSKIKQTNGTEREAKNDPTGTYNRIRQDAAAAFHPAA